MYKSLPGNLIFNNSRLKVVYDKQCRVNKTKSAIIISGTRGGFLSLSNIILFQVNNLEQEIRLHDISFIETSIKFIIKIDNKIELEGGQIHRDDGGVFIWNISEGEADHVAASIHSLGHINSELHLDQNKTLNDLSVYCVVE